MQSRVIYTKYAESLYHAQQVMEDLDVVELNALNALNALNVLRADLYAVKTKLEEKPDDMDVLQGFPDVNEIPILVLGSWDEDEGEFELRFTNFPVDVDAVLKDPAALQQFVREEVDYCLEENVEMTEPALCSLRPVRMVQKKTGVWWLTGSGYNCCDIDVAKIVDGKVHIIS